MKQRIEKPYKIFTIYAAEVGTSCKAIAYDGDKVAIKSATGASVSAAIFALEAELDAILTERCSKRRQPHIATIEEFKFALKHLNLTDSERSMLNAHKNALNRTMTADELAKSAGFDGYGAANMVYGKLAHKIGVAIGLETPFSKIKDDVKLYTRYLAESPSKPSTEAWLWVMHEELAGALES